MCSIPTCRLVLPFGLRLRDVMAYPRMNFNSSVRIFAGKGCDDVTPHQTLILFSKRASRLPSNGCETACACCMGGGECFPPRQFRQ